MQKVLGDLIALQLNEGTVSAPIWNLVVCITEQDLDLAAEEIDAASKCGPDILAGQLTSTSNFTGYHDAAPDTPGAVSTNDLIEVVQSKAVRQWRLITLGDAGATYYRGFSGRMTAFNEASNSNSPLTYTATIGISGNVITIPPTS